MTPMFSAYVVVGEPPTRWTSTVPKPSAAIARPITGSRSSPVISATALTWPMFSAISAITPGSTSRMKVIEKLGPCTSPTPSASVPLGEPTQSAALTAGQADQRSCSVASVRPAPTTELIGPKMTSKSHEST